MNYFSVFCRCFTAQREGKTATINQCCSNSSSERAEFGAIALNFWQLKKKHSKARYILLGSLMCIASNGTNSTSIGAL